MKKRFYYFILLLSLCNVAIAQSGKRIEIGFSSSKITLGENFAIQATLNNINTNSSPTFPSIPGLKKLQVSQSQQTTIINGRRSNSIVFTQYYQSTKEGKFKIPPFTISSGGISTSHNGITITVSKNPYFEDDSYLQISASKSTVYSGEPVKISVSFYFAQSENQLISHQNDVNEQIREIRNQIKPKNAWVEEIEQIDHEKKLIEVKGEPYYRQRLYEIVLIPQGNQDLFLPSVSLNMLKAIPTNQRDFFGRKQYKKIRKNYSSKSIKIRVKQLPEHPLKGKVPVGVFSLGEGIDRQEVKTGDNIVYSFEIKGKGNLPTLLDPVVKETDSLLVLKESDKLSYSNKTGTIRGRKVFLYNIVPQISGLYPIKDVINFPFFNYETGKYETLKSKLMITAKGNNLIDSKIQSETASPSESSTSNTNSFENNSSESQRFLSIDSPEKQNLITNLLLLLLIGGLGYLMIKGNTK